MPEPLKTIVIVGGGTAGWLTAGTIAAEHLSRDKDIGVNITLVESPNIAPIGVGEGTWPTMRSTLLKMGISETDFFRECDASFKQGAKFARWVTGGDDDYYYHPLVLPQGFVQHNLVPFWQEYMSNDSFSNSVCYQEQLCEHGLAPKEITTPEYAAVANYAYHLNAGKFSVFLQKHCVNNLGVNHILDDVIKVNSAENGDIASITTKENGDINGDLFIDCTGFKSLLLGEHFKVPFVNKKDVLFIDTALAVQAPYESEDSPIASHTISTAQEAGWIWDIGLVTRRGIGHVFCSDYISESQAEEQLRNYLRPSLGREADTVALRKIPIVPGHREKFWHKNCVAVGLAAGFLEPLEASALVLVELSAAMISEQLPANRSTMDIVAKRFNDKFLYRWDRIIDFLKLHYILSKRTDNEFWIENRNPNTIPNSLQELLELWKYHFPWHKDFTQTDEVFPTASYQYVLYGMGFKTELPNGKRKSINDDMAAKEVEKNKKLTDKYLKHLPTNRELLKKIHSYGLQTL